MAVSVTGTVSVAPITADDDVRRAAEFLQVNLNQRVSADQWEYAVDVPWAVQSPNAGFMLLDDDEIVGVQLAFYSERTIHGRCERFCNLGAWCVLPAYRFHSLRLLKAALGQTGYHFTDLSPSGNVVGINAKLGFRFLDTTTALVPNIPWPSWPGRDVISSDPELIERTLTGRELQIHRDHVAAMGTRHLVLIRDGEWCYLLFRKERRKGLRLFASILYVSNAELLRAMARPLARHLLIHHGTVAMFSERRIVGYWPRPSLLLRSPRRKMFHSPHLEPTQVDYLYSELVCVAW